MRTKIPFTVATTRKIKPVLTRNVSKTHEEILCEHFSNTCQYSSWTDSHCFGKVGPITKIAPCPKL